MLHAVTQPQPFLLPMVRSGFNLTLHAHFVMRHQFEVWSSRPIWGGGVTRNNLENLTWIYIAGFVHNAEWFEPLTTCALYLHVNIIEWFAPRNFRICRF